MIDRNESAQPNNKIQQRRALMQRLNALSVEDADDTGQAGGQKAFMIMYASLMILLMTFFIVIFAHTTYSQAKFELAKESLYSVFKTLGLSKGQELLTLLKTDVSDKKKGTPTSRFYISLAEISQELKREFNECDVELKLDSTTITIPSQKIFESDNLVLRKEAHELLRKIADYAKKDDYVAVNINSFLQPEIGQEITRNNNRRAWLISTLRAVVIQDYFVKRDLNFKRIHAMGYGRHHPVADDSFPEEEASMLNNRIEIIIERDASKAESLHLIVS